MRGPARLRGICLRLLPVTAFPVGAGGGALGMRPEAGPSPSVYWIWAR